MSRQHRKRAPALSVRHCLIAALAFAAQATSVAAAPRITPIEAREWSIEQREVASDLRVAQTNAFRTLLRNPALTRHITPFERYITSQSTLPARHRSLLILRTAWLSRSGYLWAHQADPTLRGALTTGELRRIASGPDSDGWEPFEAALLRAADELHLDSFVSDAAWATLASTYTTEQLIDALFTVGQTTMLAGAINSLGVEIEAGFEERLPSGIPYVTAATWTNKRLIGESPRVAPIERKNWTEEMRSLLDPDVERFPERLR